MDDENRRKALREVALMVFAALAVGSIGGVLLGTLVWWLLLLLP